MGSEMCIRDRVSGLGADKDLQMAYLKAIVEFFERLSFHKHERDEGIYSTNGIAAHRIAGLAKKSAEEELLERDSFMRHWFTNTPFTQVELNEEAKKLDSVLKNHQLKIHLGKTTLGHKETYLCFLQDLKTTGFALGLSSGRGSYDIEKSIQEALINYFFGHQGVSAEKQIEIIKNEGVKSLMSHRAFWLYMNPMPEWLFAKSEVKMSPSQSNLKTRSTFKQLESRPFEVWHCKNDGLLELYVGDVYKFFPSGLTEMGLNVVLGPTQYHPIP